MTGARPMNPQPQATQDNGINLVLEELAELRRMCTDNYSQTMNQDMKILINYIDNRVVNILSWGDDELRP